MENLGKYLQEQREAQRVSIEEMAFRTKIPVRYIQAIEENAFDQIPSQVSAKGFLRSYVQCLGLDDAPVLEAFAQQVIPSSDAFSASEDQDEILSYVQVKTPSRLPFPRRVLLWVGGVVVLLLIFVGLLPEREVEVRTGPPPMLSEDAPLPPTSPMFDSTETNGASGLESSQTLPGLGQNEPPDLALDPKAEAPKPPAKSPQAVLPAATPPIPEKPLPGPNAAPDSYLLTIQASEATWVFVQIDGKEVREALLQANDKVNWRGKEKFLLKLGNAGGVSVSLNGKDLGAFGPKGMVVEKEIIGAETLEN